MTAIISPVSHTPSVALIWERFGEYHHARLEHAGRAMPLSAIEVAADDCTYAWVKAKSRYGYDVHTLGESTDISQAKLAQTMFRALSAANPQVIAVPGWEAPYALLALDWARRNGRGVVMMSDSNAHDAPRSFIKEQVKAQLIGLADAGFAAGTSAKAYLGALGLPPERVTLGYDVIDNGHFARKLGALPGRGFLCVARFVNKKNHITLINAYALYRDRRINKDQELWPLTLVGDGPLAGYIRAEVARLGLEKYVSFIGFQQYSELPAIYHAAGALLLPSTSEQWGLVINEAMAAGLPVIVSNRTGAAVDLVVENETGWTVDSTDPRQLASRMTALSNDPVAAAQMGKRGAERITHWGLERFTAGLINAARIAVERPSFGASLVGRMTLSAMLAKVRVSKALRAPE